MTRMSRSQVFLKNADLAGPYRFEIPAQRTKPLRFNHFEKPSAVAAWQVRSASKRRGMRCRAHAANACSCRKYEYLHMALRSSLAIVCPIDYKYVVPIGAKLAGE
jgi:hypothetical protein